MASSDIKSLSQSLAKLGTINVKVFRVIKVTDGTGNMDEPDAGLKKSIPEKALKGQALSHQLESVEFLLNAFSLR